MRIIFPIVIAALLIGGTNLRADEEADAFVHKAIKAHGGAANLDKHMTCMIESQGSVEIYTQLAGEVEHQFKAELTAKPGKFKGFVRIFQDANAFAHPYLSMHTIYNGEGQMLVDGKSHLLKDLGLREFKAQAYHREVCLLTPLVKDRKFKLTVLDKKALVQGRPVVGIMVTHEDHQDIVLYFDQETNRLVKTKREFYHLGKQKIMELMTFFSEYKTVEGAILPHRVVSYQNGRQIVVETITRIVVLQNAPDEWFRIKE